ncbi:MAG: hypothetical protein KBT00_07055 [Bacteroidales bacterium]|nr:hypothetical protein [Candidatus Cacconaster merdequi]
MVWKSLRRGETFTRALWRGFVNKDMPWRALYRGGLFTSFVLLISFDYWKQEKYGATPARRTSRPFSFSRIFTIFGNRH